MGSQPSCAPGQGSLIPTLGGLLGLGLPWGSEEGQPAGGASAEQQVWGAWEAVEVPKGKGI